MISIQFMKQHPQHNNLLQFENLSKINEIAHFSTTRVGGVSSGSYSSFNMGNFSDDSPLNIYENRKILTHMFYMDINDFIIPHQTHGSKVLIVDDEFLALDHSATIETMYGIDAVITNKKGKFICATTADCVPILIYDNISKAIAAIHAGWKGTSARIVENTISEMQKQYGSSTKDMIVAIGPSINIEHYEVGDEVIEVFKDNGYDMSDPKVCSQRQASSKYHINLKEINRRTFINLGVPKESIETTELCTYEREDLFFSARRQTEHSGRMLTGIKLK